MALSQKTLVGTSAAVTSAGTAVTPTVAPFDNTHTIIVYNPDSSNTIYLAFTDDAAIPAADAVCTCWRNDYIGNRVSFCSTPAGTFKVDASGGTPTARIIYVNGTSS